MGGLLDRDPFARAEPPAPRQPPDPMVGVLAALDQLRAAITDMPAPPAPIVHVAPPDLGEIVQAVMGLKGAATADEIAAAIAKEMRVAPDEESAIAATLSEVAQALKKLEFRLRSTGVQAYGGGAVSLEHGAFDPIVAALAGAHAIVVSTANSTTALVPVGTPFIGDYEDVLRYQQQGVNVFVRPNVIVSGDATDAKGSLFIDYHSADTGAALTQIPYVVRAPGLFIPQVPITVRHFFRIRYYNDGGASALAALGITDEAAGTPTAQTQMSIETLLYPQPTKELLRTLDQGLSGSDPATVTMAVGHGRDPDGTDRAIRVQGRHAGNSTNTALNGGETFRGQWFRWQDSYGGAAVDMKADVDGTLYLDLSEQTAMPSLVDESGVDEPIAIPYGAVADGLFRRHFTLQSEWVRTRYVNGPTAQTDFNLDTAFLVGDTTPLSPLHTVPTGRSMGNMGQSLLLAEKQEDYTEAVTDEFVHVPATTGVTGDRGLNSHITGQSAPLDIGPVSTLVTGASTITDNDWTALPSTPLAERATICFSNLDADLDVRVSENNTKNADDGGVLFPRSSKEFDLDPGQLIYLRLADQNVTENTQNLAGTSTSNNVGVGTPDNIRVSDNNYATFDASTDSVDVTGFTITPTLAQVKTVTLKLEAKKAASPLSEQAAWVDVQTGTAGNVTSVVSAAVTANAAHFYVAAISRKNTAAAVSSVTGMGLTWTLLDDVANGADTRISVYYSTGVGATTGAVTAAFSAAATNAVIAVHRFSGVDFTSPIGSHETLTGAATNSYSDSLSAGTDRGLAVVCVNARERTHTAGGTYTERNDTQSSIGGGGASTTGEATETAPIVGTGAVAYSGTLSGTANWSLVAFTLNPQIISPIIRVRYKVGAEAYGPTDLEATLTATSDTTYSAAVTADRDWSFTNVNNVSFTVDSPTMGAITASVDAAWLEVVETNAGSTARVCYEEVGGFGNSS